MLPGLASRSGSRGERRHEAVQDVRFRYQALFETEVSHQGGEHEGAAGHVWRSGHLDAREPSTAGRRLGQEARQRPLYSRPGEPVMVHRPALVGSQALVKTSQRGHRTGQADQGAGRAQRGDLGLGLAVLGGEPGGGGSQFLWGWEGRERRSARSRARTQR